MQKVAPSSCIQGKRAQKGQNERQNCPEKPVTPLGKDWECKSESAAHTASCCNTGQHTAEHRLFFRAAPAPVSNQHSGRNNKTSATAPNTRPTISRPTGHPDGHPDATRLLDTESVASPRVPTEALANPNLGMGPTKTKTSINIASLNICGGLYSKEELICQLAQEKSLHVLALCETELEHIDEKLSFNICGYKTLLPPKREGEKFTRLLLLVKQDLECVHRQDLSNSACIYVELKYPHTQQRLLICCFYREFQVPMYCTQPADCTKAMTAQEGRFLSFGTTLSKACNEGKDIYIMGDLNIDLLRINDDTYYNKSLARIYQSMMGENGLTPIRMGTTFRRIQQNGVVKESELDHLLTTCPQKVIRHGAEEFGASDHHCIMA